ncbi:MAG: glycosyltransferase family 39 protein, partial [Thermomicrobiales bacterium]|nr:glycosyltransferase family 39 protein [Thermomicrobiales bacterium]
MATPRPAGRHLTFDTWHVALVLVFLAALSLRLYGLNWDQGADLHPDELFVAKIVLIDRIHLDWPPDLAQLLDPARSGLNPRSVDPVTGQYREFAYGALPLWVTDFVAWGLSRLTGTNWNAAERAFLLGRVLSAFLSSLTVLLTAALGYRLGGRSLGLVAALFAALAPMSIQLAHFFTTDSWLTCFVALCLLACCRAAERGTVAAFALAGCTFGLAMATKGSVVALGAPIAAALLMRVWGAPEPHWPARLRAVLPQALAAGFASLAAFFAFEPYALLRPAMYVQSLRTQADIVSGAFDVPFTRVFSGTPQGVYQVEQVVRWGLGPVAGVLALGGLVWLAHQVWQRATTAI